MSMIKDDGGFKSWTEDISQRKEQIYGIWKSIDGKLPKFMFNVGLNLTSKKKKSKKNKNGQFKKKKGS